MPKLPGVNHLDAVRALQRAGFQIARQGKHIVMTDGDRILTIPRANPINAFTMGGIARDAGLTVEDSDAFCDGPANPSLQRTGSSCHGVCLTTDRPPAHAAPSPSLRSGTLRPLNSNR